MQTIGQWTGADARAFQDAARLTNERLAQRLNVSVRTVAYWRKQAHGTLPDLAQRAFTKALAEAPEAVQRHFDEIRQAPHHAPDLTAVIADAAGEAESDPLLLAAGCDGESLTWLGEQGQVLARAWNRPTAETFGAARRLRCQALAVAERTRRPAVLSDLYVIVGQATALMASTAFDLNHWDASDTLAMSAGSYASLAGHDSLQAWTLGLRALLANWRNEPDTALAYFERGLAIAPAGIPRLRLRHIAARSLALLGDRAKTDAVLAEAGRDRHDAEQHRDQLSDDTGGEFAFGSARADACAATAWLDLGRGGEAQKSARRALDALTAEPVARRPLSQVSGARIDLASAYLISHDRDAAQEVLRDVLELSPALRNVSLAGRLARVRDILASGYWSTDSQADQLSDAIGVWMADRPNVLSA